MNNYKMYMITGANRLYFIWANLPEKDIRLHIRNDETMEECNAEKAYSIRYGGQPLYELYTGVDRLSGLPYVAEATIDKRQFRIDNNIKSECAYF